LFTKRSQVKKTINATKSNPTGLDCFFKLMQTQDIIARTQWILRCSRKKPVVLCYLQELQC